jgi:glycine dehydrogenase subunit 1
MAAAATRRRGVLVSDLVDPRYVDVLETYARGSGLEVSRFGSTAGGVSDRPEVGDDVAAVVLQHPNHHGTLEDARAVFAAAAAGGARSIQIFDPLSLGVLAPPGELGADIAIAEGQVLGNHLTYGGPYLGVIAARQQDVRRMPGRIVGETIDVHGRTGYVLTLQAREQHIRREKATSNICTNQTLMAVAATVYLGWLGPGGLAELGRQCAAKAGYAASRLSAIPGVELLHPGAAFFKEFALRLPRPPADVVEAMVERGFLAGVPLGDEALLVAVTERRTRAEIDRFAEAMAEVMS